MPTIEIIDLEREILKVTSYNLQFLWNNINFKRQMNAKCFPAILMRRIYTKITDYKLFHLFCSYVKHEN